MARQARTLVAALMLALPAAAALAALPGPPPPEAGTFVDFPLEEVAALDHPLLEELSGLVAASPHQPGYWAHNDSGAEPRLFALDADLTITVPPWLSHRYSTGTSLLRAPWPGTEVAGATLVDWEDIARIGDTLYLADVGNNGNARRDLGFWELAEPALAAVEVQRPLRFLPVHYPEQRAFPGELWEWDCEAVFADREALYLVTKHRRAGEIDGIEAGARLYRFEPRRATTDVSTGLAYVSRQDDVLLATAADLSPDGQVLALLTYSAVWFFARPEAGDDWFAGQPVIRPLSLFRTRQAEAVAWRDDGRLLIGNEAGSLFEMIIDRSALQAGFSPAP
jgi:hypothetical protein